MPVPIGEKQLQATLHWHFTDKVIISARLQSTTKHGIPSLILSLRLLGRTPLWKRLQRRQDESRRFAAGELCVASALKNQGGTEESHLIRDTCAGGLTCR